MARGAPRSRAVREARLLQARNTLYDAVLENVREILVKKADDTLFYYRIRVVFT